VGGFLGGEKGKSLNKRKGFEAGKRKQGGGLNWFQCVDSKTREMIEKKKKGKRTKKGASN